MIFRDWQHWLADSGAQGCWRSLDEGARAPRLGNALGFKIFCDSPFALPDHSTPPTRPPCLTNAASARALMTILLLPRRARASTAKSLTVRHVRASTETTLTARRARASTEIRQIARRPRALIAARGLLLSRSQSLVVSAVL
jgi:hypothetical protein